MDTTPAPIPIPTNDPVTLSMPNLLTITMIAPESKNDWEFFPSIFVVNPIVSPKITKIA